MTRKEEEILVARIKKGDKEAFRRLFESYYPLFLSFAKKLLHNNSIAEDMVQNVFMRLWTLRANLDETRSIRNYILAAIRNEVNYFLRSTYRVRYEELTTEIADESISPENRINAGTIIKDVSSAISEMPERRREVFKMSRKEGLSNKEIAERLGISVRTVEKHIENALSELKHRFPVSAIAIFISLFN